MADVWRSDRLVYRALDSPNDEKFVKVLQSDSEGFTNATAQLPVPQGNAHAKALIELLQQELLAVVICLAPLGAATVSSTQSPTSIGILTLRNGSPKLQHHGCAHITVDIMAPYRGQGHGTESIKWALQWGFNRANLHRIEIGAYEWNPGALKLYERLGFTPEARRRERFFYNGKYYDLVEFGMLVHEWRALHGSDK
ncbi:putative gnat family protein [Acrodontium crateriforme]|uniref:Gnat family protein n=1 Tax=Acrodontium crateriforme TaxID=150365 RepID=A0AAQ3LZS3_9PEZI|nr:putative gnat family protein [Acrodontium crateriforme]